MESPILDYAGPVSRSSLRLAAKSEIHVDEWGERVVVRETLAGRGRAIGALVFAALVIAALLAMQLDMLSKWHKHIIEFLVTGGLEVAEIVVAALVINQTWRRTVLTVTPDDLLLTFAAPISRREQMSWPTGLLTAVDVVDTFLPPRGSAVPELELRLSAGGPIRLFTGHPKAQLDWLAGRIRAVTRR